MGQLNVTWSKPYKIKVGGWQRKWLIPTNHRSDFFSYWKKNGLELKSRGYTVLKEDSDWYLLETQLTKSLFDIEPKKDSQIEEDTKELVVVPLSNTNGLRPWQVNAASKICAAIKKWGAAIDGSDTGTGKTYSACAVARELGMDILVVCPKAVIASWQRVICKHFNLSKSLIGVINYESLKSGKKESHIASYVKRRETRRKEFVWKISKNTLIIWDEGQKLKGANTKNSETCLAAIAQGYKMLFCSATLATNPLELKTVGTGLKLFSPGPGYYKWLYEHGVTKGRFGLEFKGGKEHLIKLHKDLFGSKGVRLRRDDIPNFPESEIIADCYDIEDAVKLKIEGLYKNIDTELKKLRNKIKAGKGASALVEILRARQEIELLKIPLFVEMIEDGIESGMSVVVFCNFTETIHVLSDRLKTKCIVNGESQYEKFRQQNIDDFQSDKERIILVNVAAGGAGLSLHDLNGNYPRLALISPSYSAVHMRQATGRVWRDSAKTKSLQKILFISGTVEEKVCESVKQKLNNLDLLNDGDLLETTNYI